MLNRARESIGKLRSCQKFSNRVNSKDLVKSLAQSRKSVWHIKRYFYNPGVGAVFVVFLESICSIS